MALSMGSMLPVGQLATSNSNQPAGEPPSSTKYESARAASSLSATGAVTGGATGQASGTATDLATAVKPTPASSSPVRVNLTSAKLPETLGNEEPEIPITGPDELARALGEVAKRDREEEIAASEVEAAKTTEKEALENLENWAGRASDTIKEDERFEPEPVVPQMERDVEILRSDPLERTAEDTAV